jgi:hypothetical protein
VPDAARSYQLVLDGQPAGVIRNGATKQLEVAAGTHTLQLRSLHIINRHLGLASPTATLVVGEGDTLKYVCHPHPFLQIIAWWIRCLRSDRSRWIALSPAHP